MQHFWVLVDNTMNLDLNTTARKNEKTNDKFSPYLSHMIRNSISPIAI